MKNWNSILLESIIRDALFEQAAPESGKTVIRPMLGLEGERKIARAKEAMGITDPVDNGFVVINRKSSAISNTDIVDAIQNSREFGKGSRYDTDNWVYLISNDRSIGNNSSKRDVLILQRKNYSVLALNTALDAQYNALLGSISPQERDRLGLPGGQFTFLVSTAMPTTMNAYLFFDTDIDSHRRHLAARQSDIDRMKRLGPATGEYMKQIADLQRLNDKLKRELETIKLSPTAPTADEAAIAAGAEPGAANQESNTAITDVYNSSDAELISQLQRDIIKMVNNNPQIYPTNPQFKQTFDLFINRYKDDGRWGTNMSNMVELINQGFEAGSSGSVITKQVYNLIIKYQTDTL